MTYKSRGRSMTEAIMGALFFGFLVGFVTVLCIGNYYRAKRAMERQRLRRLARLPQGGGNGLVDSPKSSSASGSEIDPERQHLLAARPALHLASPTPPQLSFSHSARRRTHFDNTDTESLLFQVDDRQAANLLGV